MNKVELYYDSNELNTKVFINEQEIDFNQIKGKTLTELLNSFSENRVTWNGLFAELESYIATTEFKIVFYGREEDLEILKSFSNTLKKEFNLTVRSQNEDAIENFKLAMEYYRVDDFKKTIQYLTKAAEQGHAKAQNNLGQSYYNGDIIEKNYIKAFKWFSEAANQNNEVAQYNLAKCYYYGEGTAKNFTKAVEWYTKAAGQGHLWASLALTRQDNSEQQDNSNEQSDADEQYKLGDCYFYGEGVEQDFGKAVYCFVKAAEQGHVDAKNRLEWCKEEMQGDFEKASYWYKKAKEPDNADADFAGAIAFYWYTKAADQNNVDAQYSLGVCYHNGEGVAKDFKTAVEWFTKAAKQGNIYAQNDLGKCYYNGEGVTQDLVKAIYWYKKSAEQDYADAQNNLGECYYNGEGVTQNLKEAAKWFVKAGKKDIHDVLSVITNIAEVTKADNSFTISDIKNNTDKCKTLVGKLNVLLKYYDIVEKSYKNYSGWNETLNSIYTDVNELDEYITNLRQIRNGTLFDEACNLIWGNIRRYKDIANTTYIPDDYSNTDL